MNRSRHSWVPQCFAASLLLAPLALVGCEDETTSPDSIQATTQVESPQLRSDLLQLREEEKLARDVYLTLHERWELDIFLNISGSEQRHMDKVGDLLTMFDIDDPIVDDGIGVFTDPKLGTLYVELAERGLRSEVQALLVGATIEDLDIFDIRAMRARAEDPAVLATYDKLECGSNNHLRAFTRQLSDHDAEYTAQYLTADEIRTIVTADSQRCGGGGGGGGGGGHGRRGH